jgi:hypothetical protein
MQPNGAHYHDQTALLDRLTDGVRRQGRPVVFLVGSPLTAPHIPNFGGVPNVDGVIDLIRNEFKESVHLPEFERALHGSGNPYQSAFFFLIGRRGQQVANEIIKRAVWQARKTVTQMDGERFYSPSTTTSDDACRLLDADYQGWILPPAIEALGKLIALYPEQFGRLVLTTNFDPLIEVSVSKIGGQYYRTVLHRDGNLSQTEGAGCHVIHLHGYQPQHFSRYGKRCMNARSLSCGPWRNLFDLKVISISATT